MRRLKTAAVFIIFLAILSELFSCNLCDEIEKENICGSEVRKFASICYFTDWSYSRAGKGKYTPEDVDYKLCTHVVYAFALLDQETLNSLKSADPIADIEMKYYEKVIALKKNGVQVVLGLGGWNDSTEKYSKMLGEQKLRTKFVENITNFLTKYGFQGLDVDIEYPAYYQGQKNSGSTDDKVNFIYFLKELRKSFNDATGHKLTLSVAVSANEKIVDIAYDVVAMAVICDWIGVMAYDFHGKWEPYTGLNAPFFVQPGDEGDSLKFNVKSAMSMWLNKGAPANKLVVGISCNGRSFVLADQNKTGIHAPAKGEPNAGEYTKETGSLAFYEILDNVIEKGWTSNHEKNIGSYAFKDNHWVSYDDVYDVAVKANYVRLNGFYGAMFWALDLDCFQAGCPGGKYPLISTVKNIFDGKMSLGEVRNCT